MLLDVRPDHFQVVRDILRRLVPDREVWAFGSRAKWTARDTSDLDLCFVGDAPLGFKRLGHLRDAFSESSLPYKVDVVDWATTSESFRKIIERDKVLVQRAANRPVGGAASEWPVKTIAECASPEAYSTQIGPFGKGLMADQYTESGVPVLRGVNVNRGRFHDDDFVFVDDETADRLSKFESYPGDVLLVHKGTLGQIGLMPCRRRYHRYIMGNSMMRVRCDPAKLLPEYLYYWLSSTVGQHYLFSRVSQVGVPQIQTPLATLRQAALPVPPLPEQRAIAHILGSLDDKIELNRRLSETLEAMARALFKSWFVDFDPVRAKQPKNVGWVSPSGRNPPEKADGGLRDYAANPPYELPPHIADLFPARLVDSELGEIPEGWEVRTLGDFSSLNPETWTKETRPAVINYVDLSNTKWGRIEAVTAYAQQDAPSRALRVLRLGDTIVGTVRPGNGSYAFVVEDGLTGSTGFAVLRPLRSEFAEFVYFAATAEESIEALSHLADGGAYPAVRAEVVAGTQVIRPGDDVLRGFSRVAGPLVAKMAENERESRTLAALRDALLPKLISGELRVRDAGKVLPDATV